MKLSPIQKLDKILEILAEDTNNISIAHIVNEAKGKNSGADAQFVLTKLVKDKYAHHLEANISNVTSYTALSYSITFEGLVFHQQGGYAKQDENNKRKAKKERLNILAVSIGTVFAGLYGLFEITKWFFHHFHWHLPF